MSLEIERKFLVAHLPFSLTAHPGDTIRQGYVIATDDGIELRVRQRGMRFFQTIKMGTGLLRTEIEMELSRDQFERLWLHTEGRRVTKTRYAVPIGAHTGELDRFEGDLEGLFLIEVEFDSIAASQRFLSPDWFGKEVTEDERYKNKRLAVDGLPGQ